MKRKSTCVALGLLVCVLAVSAALYLYPALQSPVTADEDMAVIYVGSKEYLRVPLSKPQRLTVRQESGEINIIQVDESGIQMIEANCSNQHCVNTGKVSPDNWELKPDGAFIICLPNQVTVELVVAE
ncbi:MAG: NusG domain II-containing protein [Clostridia bacterium]|nr:NusG domain II-containing protein [Clostridia bacterium]